MKTFEFAFEIYWPSVLYDLVYKNAKSLTKGQLISKGLFKVFICTKNEQKYFCISALAYKKRSNQKSSIRESK